MFDNNQFWGYHLLLDCSGCDHDNITNRDNIHDFTKHLVTEIDMVAYGEPQIIHFGSDEKAGYTLVQLIETSNICAHFVQERNEMYLDVFSCKNYDPEIVKHLVNQYFAPQKIRSMFVHRQA